MFDHLIMTNGQRRTHYLHPRETNSSSDVIVLASPAPVLVRKAVHFEVLLRGYSRNPSEVLGVWEPVSELVHGHREVCGVLGMAGVGIVVILRQQVNIMQENTAPVLLFQHLTHSNIQQLRSVKGGVPRLVDDVNGVVELLSLQEGVQMVEEGAEVALPVSVRHHNGGVVPRLTVRRAVMSP